MDIAQLIADFGFPVVMVVGLGYFVYYVWQTITNVIDPSIQEMKSTIKETINNAKGSFSRTEDSNVEEATIV